MKSAPLAPWAHLGRKGSPENQGTQEFLPRASLERKVLPVLQGAVGHPVLQVPQGEPQRGMFLSRAHLEIGDPLVLKELEEPLDLQASLGVLMF